MAKQGRPRKFKSADEVWEFIKTHSVPQPSGCHHWTGTLSNHGYAMIPLGRATVVTRVILGIQDRPDLQACHTCDNPRCVNPEHLWSGTAEQNALDCVRKGRKPKQKGWV